MIIDWGKMYEESEEFLRDMELEIDEKEYKGVERGRGQDGYHCQVPLAGTKISYF